MTPAPDLTDRAVQALRTAHNTLTHAGAFYDAKLVDNILQGLMGHPAGAEECFYALGCALREILAAPAPSSEGPHK